MYEGKRGAGGEGCLAGGGRFSSILQSREAQHVWVCCDLCWPWNVLEGGCMFMTRREARVSGELTVPMGPPEGFPR